MQEKCFFFENNIDFIAIILVFSVRQIWDDGRTGRMEDGKPDRTEGRLCERKWIGDGYGMLTRCSRDAHEKGIVKHLK
jgi:hypothetical protein